MTTARVPSVPLILHDPYFSLWSPADTLFGADTCHWTNAPKPVTGTVTAKDHSYGFMGKTGLAAPEQTGLTITPLSTVYHFQAGAARFALTFTSPLLPGEPGIASRPVSYVTVETLPGESAVPMDFEFSFDGSLCYDGETPPQLYGEEIVSGQTRAVWLGRAQQGFLSHSADMITMDWGYLYLAASDPGVRFSFTRLEKRPAAIKVRFRLDAGQTKAFFAVGYDDVISLMYFDEPVKGYWTRGGKTILTALEEALAGYPETTAKCAAFDAELTARARKTGGEKYADICALSYRQSFAAHKMAVTSGGELLFLSKECESNGCIGTVDVSYPSAPLFLLTNPELLKGMLRPIFRFAKLPVWEYGFAPHDVGRYPFATGQVYGLRARDPHLGKPGGHGWRLPEGHTYPAYFMYPALSIYDQGAQMPIEECGNMLILTAALCQAEGDASFAREQLPLLEKWAHYLQKHGLNPGLQLCTDDFAEHIAGSANLSAKAVLGVAAYGLLLARLGSGESQTYLDWAREAARAWQEKARQGSRTSLTLGGDGGWSMKYNLVWDLYFGTRLFPRELFGEEIRHYLLSANDYGIPLDSRADYAKTDWTAWCAAFAQSREDFDEIMDRLHRYITQTPDRVAFGDWYDTKTACIMRFRNRTVQGGMFMPMLIGENGQAAGE